MKNFKDNNITEKTNTNNFVNNKEDSEFKNNIKKGENCICNTLLYCKGNVSLESEADEPKNIF